MARCLKTLPWACIHAGGGITKVVKSGERVVKQRENNWPARWYQRNNSELLTCK
jgi:hypothetical protein